MGVLELHTDCGGLPCTQLPGEEEVQFSTTYDVFSRHKDVLRQADVEQQSVNGRLDVWLGFGALQDHPSSVIGLVPERTLQTKGGDLVKY